MQTQVLLYHLEGGMASHYPCLYSLAKVCATTLHHLCSAPPQLYLLFPLLWGYLKIQAQVSDAKAWLTHTQISAGKFARLLWETHTARSICSLTSLLCPSTFTYTLRRLRCPCWHMGICWQGLSFLSQILGNLYLSLLLCARPDKKSGPWKICVLVWWSILQGQDTISTRENRPQYHNVSIVIWNSWTL